MFLWGFLFVLKCKTEYNGLGIKEVAEGNLGEGAKQYSLLSAVIRPERFERNEDVTSHAIISSPFDIQHMNK